MVDLSAWYCPNASDSALAKMVMMFPRRLLSLADPLAALSNRPFCLGLGLNGEAFLLYAASLVMLPLNIAHPVLILGPLAMVEHFSVLIFRESIHWTTGAGILLVVAGLALITALVA